MMGGALATAGGLTFTGEGNGNFNAYDSKTGKLLWQFNGGAGCNSAPMTFKHGGEQFIAVACGGNFQLSYPLGDARPRLRPSEGQEVSRQRPAGRVPRARDPCRPVRLGAWTMKWWCLALGAAGVLRRTRLAGQDPDRHWWRATGPTGGGWARSTDRLCGGVPGRRGIRAGRRAGRGLRGARPRRSATAAPRTAGSASLTAQRLREPDQRLLLVGKPPPVANLVRVLGGERINSLVRNSSRAVARSRCSLVQACVPKFGCRWRSSLPRGRRTYEASRTVVLGSGVRSGERRRSPAHDADEQRLELHFRRQRERVPRLRESGAMAAPTATPGGIVGAGAATGPPASAPACSRRSRCSTPRARKARPTSACTSGSRRRSSAAPAQQRQRTAARLLRRPDRHASGVPDGRRHLGPDPRRPRARPLRPAEHPDRPDPVRRRRHRWPAGGGTTLGRIGFGYIYPQFKAQMTYSHARRAGPSSSRSACSIRRSNAARTPRSSSRGSRPRSSTPRATPRSGSAALAQNNKHRSAADESATAWGGSGGVRLGFKRFSLTASGYYGKGIGTTLMFLGGTGADRRHRRQRRPAQVVSAASASSPSPRPTARSRSPAAGASASSRAPTTEPATSRPRTGWPRAASTTRPPSRSRSSASSTTP